MARNIVVLVRGLTLSLSPSPSPFKHAKDTWIVCALLEIGCKANTVYNEPFHVDANNGETGYRVGEPEMLIAHYIMVNM